MTSDNDEIGDSASNSKRVSFGTEADEVHPVVPAKSELTDEEISSLWYTRSDLDVARNEILDILMTIRSKPSKKKELCIRGLEMQTDRVRKLDATKATKAMMEEQKRQKELGVNDPEQLAMVYRAKAIYCEETAVRMGREDEEEAELALAELDRPKKESVLKSFGRALQAVPGTFTPKSSPAGGTGERKRSQPRSPKVSRKGALSPMRGKSLMDLIPRSSPSGEKRKVERSPKGGRKGIKDLLQLSNHKNKKKDMLSASDHRARVGGLKMENLSMSDHVAVARKK